MAHLHHRERYRLGTEVGLISGSGHHMHLPLLSIYHCLRLCCKHFLLSNHPNNPIKFYKILIFLIRKKVLDSLGNSLGTSSIPQAQSRLILVLLCFWLLSWKTGILEGRTHLSSLLPWAWLRGWHACPVGTDGECTS